VWCFGTRKICGESSVGTRKFEGSGALGLENLRRVVRWDSEVLARSGVLPTWDLKYSESGEGREVCRDSNLLRVEVRFDTRPRWAVWRDTLDSVVPRERYIGTRKCVGQVLWDYAMCRIRVWIQFEDYPSTSNWWSPYACAHCVT
jgi:hypothetical protein